MRYPTWYAIYEHNSTRYYREFNQFEYYEATQWLNEHRQPWFNGHRIVEI
jgi:hypothetical protein